VDEKVTVQVEHVTCNECMKGSGEKRRSESFNKLSESDGRLLFIEEWQQDNEMKRRNRLFCV